MYQMFLGQEKGTTIYYRCSWYCRCQQPPNPARSQAPRRHLRRGSLMILQKIKFEIPGYQLTKTLGLSNIKIRDRWSASEYFDIS